MSEPNDVDTHVGRQLRRLRELKGLPQKELARLLGVSFQQVQKYENGANRVSASRLWEAARILEVGPEQFFEGLEGLSGRRSGEADGGAQSREDNPRTRQVLDLYQKFLQIESPRLRRQVVQLVKALADEY